MLWGASRRGAGELAGVAHNKAMKIHLIGRLAILSVCLGALGVFCLVFGANNNQAVRRLGNLLVVLSVIISWLPLLASVIYLGVQKIRRLWYGVK